MTKPQEIRAQLLQLLIAAIPLVLIGAPIMAGQHVGRMESYDRAVGWWIFALCWVTGAIVAVALAMIKTKWLDRTILNEEGVQRHSRLSSTAKTWGPALVALVVLDDLVTPIIPVVVYGSLAGYLMTHLITLWVHINRKIAAGKG